MNASNQLLPQKFEISYDCFPATLFNVMIFKDGKIYYSEKRSYLITISGKNSGRKWKN